MPSSNLVVADSDLARAQALGASLAEHGFETRAVCDGGDAIIVAETWPADAAVLALPLAGVSGLDVARHLRHSFGASFRLVACAAANDDASLRHLDSAGFDRVVSSAEPRSILSALGEATRALVERSMRQSVRRIELLIVLGHSLLGLREQTAAPSAALEKGARIVALVSRDVSMMQPGKDRERLQRELDALAERIPDPRIVRFQE